MGQNNEKMQMSLDYLASFKNDVSKAVDDIDCMKCLDELSCQSVDMNIYIENEAYSLFASYLAYFASICEEIDFEAFYNEQHKTNLNKRQTLMFSKLLRLLNIIVSHSPQFNIKFNQTCGLKALLKFIENKKSIEGLAKSENDDTDLLNVTLADLNWLSKCSEENKQNWSEINAVDILLNNGVKYVKKKKTLLILYSIVTNIVDDKRIENDSSIHKCTDLLLEFFQMSTGRLNNGDCIAQEKEFYIDNVISKQKAHYFMINQTRTTLISILQALYRLSINETMRYKIYESENFKKHVQVYFSKGTPFELRCILNLLGQISFTPKLASDLSKEEKIVKSINKIINSDDNESDELHLKQTCKNIKWNIEINQFKEKAATEIVPKSVKEECYVGATEVVPNKQAADEEKSRHVMISYNTASRELCIRVKQQLELLGIKIWMDVNDMHGSSLAAMANAVEKSYCVLMCVTEKYRGSLNCQAEAQYAFKLNKPIIPLIMQQGCENITGWLGIIMGDKIFINFMKYDFGECLIKLKNELDNYVKDTATNLSRVAPNVEQHLKVDVSPQTAILDAAPKKSEDISTRKAAEEWDEKAVLEWFNQNQINEEIQKSLQPCNGEILKQMHDMKCRAPEFYYQSMSKIGAHDMITITRLSACLDKLFNK